MDRYQIILNKKQKSRSDNSRYANYRIYNWKGQIVFEEKFPRANKEHICEKCQGMIRKGHFYKLTTLKSPSMQAYRSFKLCLPCAASLQSQNQLY